MSAGPDAGNVVYGVPLFGVDLWAEPGPIVVPPTPVVDQGYHIRPGGQQARIEPGK